MPPARPWTDEYTLLCERCGYVVEGLPTEGACPECGKPIAESLPERRVGTAWQQKPSMSALFSTWGSVLLHPRRTMEIMRPDLSTTELRVVTLVLAVGITMLTGVALPIFSDIRSRNAGNLGYDFDGLGMALFVALACSYPAFLIVEFLTRTEALGIRFLGRRHGFRISHSISSVICDHGSVGWLLGSIGLSVSSIILVWFDGGHRRTLPDWVWMIPILAAAAGFLFFETFAWIGLHRLKYANRSRPVESADTVAKL